jgi:hypothetical protein
VRIAQLNTSPRLLVKRACALAFTVAVAAIFSGCLPFVVFTAETSDLPRAMVSADFDGNGGDDVIVGFNGSFAGLEMATVDDYGFWTFGTVSGALVPRSDLLITTDFNSDGAPDVVAAGKGGSDLVLLRNNGSGAFIQSSLDLPGTSPSLIALKAAPLDGEQLVVAAYDDGGVKHIATWAASGSTLVARGEPAWSQPSIGAASAIDLYDNDDDGQVDLFVGASGGTVNRFSGAGGTGAQFASAPVPLTASPGSGTVTAVAVGDAMYNGMTPDGIADVIAGFDTSTDAVGWRGSDGGALGSPVVVGSYSPGAAVSAQIRAGRFLVFSDENQALDGFGDQVGQFTAGGCDENVAYTLVNPLLAPSYPWPPPAIAGGCGRQETTSDPFLGHLTIYDNFFGRLKTPGPTDLGSVQVGSTTTQLIETDPVDSHVTSGEEYNSVYFNNWTLTGADASQFTVAPRAGGYCESAYTGLDACKADVTFTPTSPGAKHAKLVINTDARRIAGAPLHFIDLTATATAPELEAPSVAAAGDIVVDHSQVVNVALKNTGTATLTFDDFDLAAGTQWSLDNGTCGATLAIGSTCQLQLTFSPTATGTDNGSLTISGDQFSGDKTISLTGRGVVGAVTSPPVNFGDVRFGHNRSTTVTLKNEDNHAVTISSLSITGTDAARFSVVSNYCAGAIAVDATCTAVLRVSPTARGSLSASLQINSNATTSPSFVALAANGTRGELTIASAPGSFGPLRVGFEQNQSITIRNDGDAMLQVGTLAVPAPFSVGRACNSMQLEPGGTCKTTVTFTPTGEGQQSAALHIPNDGDGSTDSVDLSGIALPSQVVAPSPPTGGGQTGEKPAKAKKPSLKLRRQKISARGRSVFVGFKLTAGSKAIKNGMVTIDLPGHLRWYRMHRNSRVLARLPRTVRIPVAHLSAGSSRGIAIRLVGADFANNKHRLTGKLSAGKAGSDSLVFTVGTTR